MDIQDYDWSRLKALGFDEEFVEKATGELKEACWKGYTAVGTKMKNGREVPNCVPVKKKKKAKTSDHSEKFDLNKGNEINEMSANSLPKAVATGPVKNPEMGEHKIRMPRMEEIEKANEKDGHLAMAAAPNYSETEDFSDRFSSDEPNARMIITQLRVMREKIDIMLGMLYPDDNLEPWAATKIANAGVGIASVADYLRFGGET